MVGSRKLETPPGVHYEYYSGIRSGGYAIGNEQVWSNGLGDAAGGINFWYEDYVSYLRSSCSEYGVEWHSESGDGSGNGECRGDGDFKGIDFRSKEDEEYEHWEGNYTPCNVDVLAFDGHEAATVDGFPTIILGSPHRAGSVWVARARAIGGAGMSRHDCFLAWDDDGVAAHGESQRDAIRDLERKRHMALTSEERVEAAYKALGPDDTREVPCSELYELHGLLTGSCEYGRKAFARERGIDIERDSWPVWRFLDETAGSYGGEQVKALRRRYYHEREADNLQHGQRAGHPGGRQDPDEAGSA